MTHQVRVFSDRGTALDGSRTLVALDGGDPIYFPPITPPPPPTGSMLVGASFQNSEAQITTDETQLGATLGVLRAYDTNFPASYSASQASKGGNRPMVISHVFNSSQMASGALDAQYNNILNGAPPGRKIWWCVGRHEPDAKINNGQDPNSIATWQNSAKRMADMVHAKGNANWKTAVITTLQPWDPPAGADYVAGDFWLPGYTDIWTVDKFNPNKDPDTNPAYQPLSNFIGVAVNYFKAHSIPWGVTETNTYEAYTDLTKKANWIRQAGDYCAGNGALLWCYWDKAFGSDANKQARTIASSSTSIAAMRAVMDKYNP